MGPHEEAEIQRQALRRGKNLAFSEDICLEKERVRSYVTPRKVGVGLKRKQEPSKRRLGWRLAFNYFNSRNLIARNNCFSAVLRPSAEHRVFEIEVVCHWSRQQLLL